VVDVVVGRAGQVADPSDAAAGGTVVPRASPLVTCSSMAASTASGSLCPPRLNSLMPLSGIGLWLAESITPRSAPV